MKKIAIIGCGRIAKRHAENITDIGKLAAVCDELPEKAAAFAESFGAKSYTSIDDLLKVETTVDLVVVCTPNGLHAEHIIKSLQAGKDVLTEKPLCLTTAAAWQIIETAKFCRRRLFIVKSARYNPVLQQLKTIVDRKELGDIYSIQLNCLWNRNDEYYTDWKGKTFPDGGTLYNQFSHYIDVLLWLFGEIKTVKGFSANFAHKESVEFEDTGTAALQFSSGALGTFNWSVNAYQKNCEIALTIVAEKGTLRIGGENLNEVQYAVTEKAFQFPSYQKENWSNHGEVYAHLLQELQTPTQTFPDVFDGLRTVETIEKIYKATN
ncbi:MAG TPA: Gfo/Idh/MocA family oxidoreductase [Flavisolibacter sp.]|nr:Gfo/Idh/MocA family oxidoreductase [Flavisolibacter sp.]